VTSPATPGITGAIDVPATRTGSGSMRVTTSDTLATAIPHLEKLNVVPMPYFITATVRGNISLDHPITATLVLPLTSTFYHTHFNLGLYDVARGTWHLAVAEPAARQGDLLRLTIGRPALQSLHEPGRYIFALYATRLNAPPDAVTPPAGHRPLVAVVGDSISVLTILPQSPANPPTGTCSSGFGPPPNCEYTVDFTISYPGVIGMLTGSAIRNFARPDNGETTVGKNAWLVNQVPYIPPDTDVVVFEGGRADMIFEPNFDSSPRIEIVVKAILARAPRAKIVFLAPLCIGGPIADAWINTEKMLGPRYGAFLDTRAVTSCADVSQHTDTLHATPLGNRAIGGAVAQTIGSLWSNRVQK
jgi:hypothetical protein